MTPKLNLFTNINFFALFFRCRKRRLDQISTLTEEVDQLETVRKEMQQERAALEVKLQ